jgi:hypothetical protein
MSRALRLIIAVIILIVSLSLLIWGYLPSRRETRVQPIPPSELQLPTPETFLPTETFVSTLYEIQ